MNATAVLVALVAAVGATAAAAVTWLVSRRQASGRISTSSADQLWRESQAMRGDMRAEIVGLRSEVVGLRQELAEARTETRELRADLRALRNRLSTSEGKIDRIEEAEGSDG